MSAVELYEQPPEGDVTAHVAESLFSLARGLARLDERLTAQTLVKIWLGALRTAGVKAKNAIKWEHGHVTSYPFVIEMPCPHEHRSEDRRSLASVRLLVEDNGMAGRDLDSPCIECTDEVLTTWLLTCPRCDGGESWEDHDYCEAPFDFVLAEFTRRDRVAWARWWVEHTAEATAALRDRAEPWDYWPAGWSMDRVVEWHLQGARRVLDHVVVDLVTASDWTAESAADWLDKQTNDAGKMLVPISASQRAAWSAVQALPNRPPKNTVEAAQTIRKSRATP